MHQLLSDLGVNASSDLSVFLFCTIFTFAVVTILWVVGLFQGNHSMMDGWYGFAFAVPALLAYLIVGAQSVTAALLLFMVMLHGGRLGWYLAARWRRYVPEHGGDPRYLRFVEQMSPGYWWKSFLRVMEPQAVVIVLVGMPAVVGILKNREPNGASPCLRLPGCSCSWSGSTSRPLPTPNSSLSSPWNSVPATSIPGCGHTLDTPITLALRRCGGACGWSPSLVTPPAGGP